MRYFRLIVGITAIVLMFCYLPWQAAVGVWMMVWAHNMTFHHGQKPDKL